MGASERRKGAVAEREAAGVWGDLIGHEQVIRRRTSDQSAEGGADLIVAPQSSLPLSIQVKRTERLKIHEAIRQAENDAADGHAPTVMFRRNRGGWYLVIAVEDGATLVRESMLAGLTDEGYTAAKEGPSMVRYRDDGAYEPGHEAGSPDDDPPPWRNEFVD